MKEVSVPISKLNPFFMGFLEPQELLLKKNFLVLIMEILLKET